MIHSRKELLIFLLLPLLSFASLDLSQQNLSVSCPPTITLGRTRSLTGSLVNNCSGEEAPLPAGGEDTGSQVGWSDYWYGNINLYFFLQYNQINHIFCFEFYTHSVNSQCHSNWQFWDGHLRISPRSHLFFTAFNLSPGYSGKFVPLKKAGVVSLAVCTGWSHSHSVLPCSGPPQLSLSLNFLLHQMKTPTTASPTGRSQKRDEAGEETECPHLLDIPPGQTQDSQRNAVCLR